MGVARRINGNATVMNLFDSFLILLERNMLVDAVRMSRIYNSIAFCIFIERYPVNKALPNPL